MNKWRAYERLAAKLTADEYDSWYTARFVVTRKLANNSAGSLFTVDIDQHTKKAAYDSPFRNVGRIYRPLATFWDVLNFCAAWAADSGARHMEIEPA